MQVVEDACDVSRQFDVCVGAVGVGMFPLAVWRGVEVEKQRSKE